MYKDTLELPEYIGVFASQLNAFIEEKRAIGYKYNIEPHILKQFDRFSVDFPDEHTLSKALVTKWNEKRPYERARNHLTRISVIRQFALYLCRMGVEAYVTSHTHSPNIAAKYAPHIYTTEELRCLFSQIDNCDQCTRSKNRHLAMPLIFRLLYGCGLRLSEVLSLRVCDVDLDAGVLTIQMSKFGKSRYIPMVPSLTQRMIDFKRQVLCYAENESYFFESPQGGRYANRSIYAFFRKVLWLSGISHGGRGNGPRIHDFRHTFAVHCLRKWVDGGANVTAALPYLSAYMGHSGFESTQFYLRLTADMHSHILEKANQQYGDIVPQLEGWMRI